MVCPLWYLNNLEDFIGECSFNLNVPRGTFLSRNLVLTILETIETEKMALVGIHYDICTHA